MRNLTTDVIAELKKGLVRPFLAFEATFVSGIVRCWTGFGDLTLFSNTFLGIGTFGGVSAIAETTEVQAQGISFTLDGVPQDIIDKGLSECRINYPAKLYLGFLTDSGSVIADPGLAFAGLTDAVSANEGAETASITLNCENRLIDLQRPRVLRYTDDDQKRKYPTDQGFIFVPMVQEADLPWGKLK